MDPIGLPPPIAIDTSQGVPPHAPGAPVDGSSPHSGVAPLEVANGDIENPQFSGDGSAVLALDGAYVSAGAGPPHGTPASSRAAVAAALAPLGTMSDAI